MDLYIIIGFLLLIMALMIRCDIQQRRTLDLVIIIDNLQDRIESLEKHRR